MNHCLGRWLLDGAADSHEAQLLEHRSGPVVIDVCVDQILTGHGVWQPYQDAQAELDRRYDAIGALRPQPRRVRHPARRAIPRAGTDRRR